MTSYALAVERWEPPVTHIAADVVVLTVRQEALNLLTIERGIPPFEGCLALPGGYIQETEDPADAASRELFEETGISSSGLHLEQLGFYGRPGRDPRGRVVSLSYLALAPDLPIPEGATDAARAAWLPVAEIGPDKRYGPLAFDHDEILRDGVERARAKLEYTTLATAFCAAKFTLGELRRVYEVVWGIPLDPRNFQRKVRGTEGFVLPTQDMRQGETGRPAQLYVRGDATTLYPSILRTPPA